jgi:hypothetical protein
MKCLAVLLYTIFFFSCKPAETVLRDDLRAEYIERLVPIVLPVETRRERDTVYVSVGSKLTEWQKTKQEIGGLAIGICAALIVSVVWRRKKR